MLNGLDLFSGIGGLTIALAPWVYPLAYCECDPYAQAVLLSRIGANELPAAYIWNDVQSLRPSMLGSCDIIYAGFPCQDISVAGSGKGLAGERSGLFFEIIRLVRVIRPRFVFLENVPAITFRGGIRVIEEFAALRYDCRWTIISAAELGAPHLRKRWFLLAHTNCKRCGQRSNGQLEPKSAAMADPDGKSKIGSAKPRQESYSWAIEPTVGRVVNGLPHRVDRIKAMGNAVVPIQAREAFKKLMGI